MSNNKLHTNPHRHPETLNQYKEPQIGVQNRGSINIRPTTLSPVRYKIPSKAELSKFQTRINLVDKEIWPMKKIYQIVLQ